MSIDNRFKVHDLKGRTQEIRIDRVPDTCPRCHTSVHPQRQYGAYSGDYPDDMKVQVVYQCTKTNCREVFIAYYKQNSSGKKPPSLKFTRTAPKSAHEKDFSDEIEKISAEFVEIYNQAVAAESNDLDQVVGIGLRKALEFLIKDFVVHRNPDEEDSIRMAPLSACISEYVEDPNVTNCARRAAWLGNDETHYTRRWKDKDIDDLKLLIKLTVNWIENVLLTEQYVEEMPEST
jgi:hypothetical protein